MIFRQVARRVGYGSITFVLACFLSVTASAGAWRPREPLDPEKAQYLSLTPLTITANGTEHRFQVEVAETNEEQNTGLMHRTALGEDRGMLFAYDRPRVMQFWMRNTFIPLDMLFIDGAGRIAFIAQDVAPHDERPVGPRRPMAAQLELPAGTVARLGIKTGDQIRHAFFGNAP